MLLFFNTAYFSDADIEFLIEIKKQTGVKILAGIMPIVSHKNAIFLDNEIPGINIHANIIKMFSADMDRVVAEKIGIKIAADFANKVKSYVDGLYIMTPFYRVAMVAQIIKLVNGGLND